MYMKEFSGNAWIIFPSIFFLNLAGLYLIRVITKWRNKTMNRWIVHQITDSCHWMNLLAQIKHLDGISKGPLRLPVFNTQTCKHIFFSTWQDYISHVWPPKRIMRPWIGQQVTKEQVHIIRWIYWHKDNIWRAFVNGLLKLVLTLGQFCQSLGLLRWIFIFIKIGIWSIHNMGNKFFIPSYANVILRNLILSLWRVFYWNNANQVRRHFWHTNIFTHKYWLENMIILIDE